MIERQPSPTDPVICPLTTEEHTSPSKPASMVRRMTEISCTIQIHTSVTAIYTAVTAIWHRSESIGCRMIEISFKTKHNTVPTEHRSREIDMSRVSWIQMPHILNGIHSWMAALSYSWIVSIREWRHSVLHWNSSIINKIRWFPTRTTHGLGHQAS